MIIDIFLQVVTYIVGAIFQFFPVVTLADIPLIGLSVRSLLLTVVLTWNGFLVTFPYAVVVWQVFQIILSFELLMLVMKFLLGSRHISNDK